MKIFLNITHNFYNGDSLSIFSIELVLFNTNMTIHNGQHSHNDHDIGKINFIGLWKVESRGEYCIPFFTFCMVHS